MKEARSSLMKRYRPSGFSRKKTNVVVTIQNIKSTRVVMALRSHKTTPTTPLTNVGLEIVSILIPKSPRKDCRGNTYLVEDVGENKQANGVEKIDDRNGYVKDVHLLVHPRTHNTGSDERAGLDYNKPNGLCDARVLAKTNEEAFDQVVNGDGQDEIVSRCPELNVQETPFVQSVRI